MTTAYFYPRPPRGGRRNRLQAGLPGENISIHALREEGDTGFIKYSFTEDISIHALREEGDGEHIAHGLAAISISIHALREEGDAIYQYVRIKRYYFYPRPPRGGRRASLGWAHLAGIISIHALREEGDVVYLGCSIHTSIFLSTPSARRATSNH